MLAPHHTTPHHTTLTTHHRIQKFQPAEEITEQVVFQHVVGSGDACFALQAWQAQPDPTLRKRTKRLVATTAGYDCITAGKLEEALGHYTAALENHAPTDPDKPNSCIFRAAVRLLLAKDDADALVGQAAEDVAMAKEAAAQFPNTLGPLEDGMAMDTAVQLAEGIEGITVAASSPVGQALALRKQKHLDFVAHKLPAAGGATGEGGLSELVSGFGRGVRGARGAREGSAEKAASEAEALAKLHAMHAALIEPIGGRLPPAAAVSGSVAQKLIFIPHDELCRVPFFALMGSDADAQPLLAGYELQVCNSLQVLKLTLDNAAAAPPEQLDTAAEALVVGYPDADLSAVRLPWAPEDIPVSKLPGAAAEAAAVAEALGAAALVGPAATREAVLSRLGAAPVVHIATHGFVNEGGDNKTILLLHDDDASNGGGGGSSSAFLSEDELDPATLPLAARLVVLPACHSGRGDDRWTGEGLVGLGRALIACGAPTVILSLWTLPDQTAKDVMASFYRLLADPSVGGGPMQGDASALLRTATLGRFQGSSLKRRWVDWAPLQVLGAGNIRLPVPAQPPGGESAEPLKLLVLNNLEDDAADEGDMLRALLKQYPAVTQPISDDLVRTVSWKRALPLLQQLPPNSGAVLCLCFGDMAPEPAIRDGALRAILTCQPHYVVLSGGWAASLKAELEAAAGAVPTVHCWGADVSADERKHHLEATVKQLLEAKLVQLEAAAAQSGTGDDGRYIPKEAAERWRADKVRRLVAATGRTERAAENALRDCNDDESRARAMLQGFPQHAVADVSSVATGALLPTETVHETMQPTRVMLSFAAADGGLHLARDLRSHLLKKIEGWTVDDSTDPQHPAQQAYLDFVNLKSKPGSYTLDDGTTRNDHWAEFYLMGTLCAHTVVLIIDDEFFATPFCKGELDGFIENCRRARDFKSEADGDEPEPEPEPEPESAKAHGDARFPGSEFELVVVYEQSKAAGGVGRAQLDDLRARFEAVVPRCSFFPAWFACFGPAAIVNPAAAEKVAALRSKFEMYADQSATQKADRETRRFEPPRVPPEFQPFGIVGQGCAKDDGRHGVGQTCAACEAERRRFVGAVQEAEKETRFGQVAVAEPRDYCALYDHRWRARAHELQGGGGGGSSSSSAAAAGPEPEPEQPEAAMAETGAGDRLLVESVIDLFAAFGWW
eukprot:SAG22_NODE_1191_length_5205_cov_718.107912_2_plen_1183_part_00